MRGPSSTPTPTFEDAPRDPLASPWRVGPATALFTTEIVVDAELESRIDTVLRSDSLRSRITVSWSRVARADQERYSGLITDFTISSTESSGQTGLPGLVLPVTVTAERGSTVGSHLTLLTPPATDCSAAAVAAQGVRELFVSVPERMVAGMTWDEVDNYTICRDSVLLAVSSVRSFAVLGAVLREGEVHIRVERVTSTEMSGAGSQFGEPIEIRGQGRSTVLLEIRLAGGLPAAGAGTSELRLEVRGRRRSQELTQRAHIMITSR